MTRRRLLVHVLSSTWRVYFPTQVKVPDWSMQTAFDDVRAITWTTVVFAAAFTVVVTVVKWVACKDRVGRDLSGTQSLTCKEDSNNGEDDGELRLRDWFGKRVCVLGSEEPGPASSIRFAGMRVGWVESREIEAARYDRSNSG